MVAGRVNRRSGGTTPSPFYAHIQLSYIYGSPTVISSNVFMGTTQAGIVQDSHCSNIIRFNNICLGVPYPLAPASGATAIPVTQAAALPDRTAPLKSRYAAAKSWR